MQVALRPYVTAGIAVIGAGLIVSTAPMAPQTQPRAIERAVELASAGGFLDLTSTVFGFQEWLAGIIDPGLVGAPAAVIDKSAVFSLDAAGSQLASVAELTTPAGTSTLDTELGAGDPSAGTDLVTATGDINAAQIDVLGAVNVLRPADAIYQFDFYRDLLLSGGGFYHGVPYSMWGDLTGMAIWAIPALQEKIALAIDPAAVNQAYAAASATEAAQQALIAAERLLAADGEYTMNPSDGTVVTDTDAAGVHTVTALTDVKDAVKYLLPASRVVDTISTEAAQHVLGGAHGLTAYPQAIADLMATLNPAALTGDLTATLGLAGSDLTAFGSAIPVDMAELSVNLLSLF